MMNMKLLAVITPPYIYHGCSTCKTFWEENFTGEENFTLGEFSAVNMKSFGRCNVRKHKEIKGSYKYVTLDISLMFGSMDKMRIISSEPKDNYGRSGKGLITSLGLKAKTSPHKYKKARHAIENFSMKDLSNIIRKFDKSPYKSYERKRPKHEPTDSKFYLARQLAKCIMRADDLNSHVYPVRTEMTGTKQILISYICSTDESESEDFLVDETLLQVYSTDEDKPKASSSMKVLQRKAIQNAPIKKLTKKNTQRMRQSIRNLQLIMIQLSMIQVILTYLNEERIY